MCTPQVQAVIKDLTPRGDPEAFSKSLVDTAQFAHKQLSEPQNTWDQFESNLRDNVESLGEGAGTEIAKINLDPKNEADDGDAEPEIAGTTPEEDDIDPWLGRLLASRRNQGLGKGISANMLTGGTGIRGKASTNRRTLLGA